MNAIHEYLRINGGTTAEAMWQELSRLRRLGCRYEDMPASQDAFNDGLDALLESGLAEKTSNGMWLWLPKVALKSPNREILQTTLF